MAAPADNPQVVAVGINCIALENTPAALAHLHSLTALPLVVYPNSGEHYDAVSKTWHHHGEACASWRIICRSGWRPGEADRRLLPHHAEGHRRA
nr:Homocysteine S-methyltransferase [Klebsiella pneumoniae]